MYFCHLTTKTFFRNLQEVKVLSAVATMKPPSERETWVIFHHAAALQAPENKVAKGNHREKMLSTMNSEVRVPERLEVEQSLSWTWWCSKGKYSIHTTCLPTEGNHFFPSSWFISLILCPV